MNSCEMESENYLIVGNLQLAIDYRKNNDYVVYILKCFPDQRSFKLKKDFSTYTGYSKNIYERFLMHLNGWKLRSNRAYVKRFKGLLDIGYIEIHNNIKEAINRELEIKDLNKDKKQELMDKKIIGICKKCNGLMLVKTIINEEKKKEILECSVCRYWKPKVFRIIE